MTKFTAALILVFAAGAAGSSQARNPFLGRWDFNIATAAGNRASWLGVLDKGGTVEVWYQPTGGNVLLMKDFTITGSHLRLVVSPASATQPEMTWELDAKGETLTGVQKRGDTATT